MSTSIRTARESDALTLASLTEQLGYTVEPSAVRARLSRILGRSDHRFAVADDQGRVLGWLHALIVEYVEADPFAIVGGLVVDAGSRRQGIGRLLMEDAENWARDRGCSVLRLSTSERRAGAHRFYEQLGYRHLKTQYSFAKPLDPGGASELRQFVPRLDDNELLRS